jgi:phosphoadenosine phosphosulfate reductase
MGDSLLVAQSAGARPRPFHDDVAVNGNGNGHTNGNGNGRVPTIGGEVVDPAEVAAEVEAMSAEEAIAWALEAFHPQLRFAVSFQKSSSVIIDLAHGIEPGARFFYLDTDLLFAETYATRDALAAHYGLEFERFAGISLAEQEAEHGPALWRRHPDACCGVRKVEPMTQALDGMDCWVSGIRRSDSQSRAGASRFGWDRRFGLWKLNPLADWTDEQIWDHVRGRDLPYNPLHDQGYPSIGCTHCTLRPGEDDDERAGRWATFDKNECGIN